MTDLERVLEDCLDQLAGGASTVEDCLARHPEFALQLKPLLRTAGQLERARVVKPSPGVRSRTRARLTIHLRAHPHGPKQRVSPFWRVAVSIAVLVIALAITGTAFAQDSLPLQPLYVLKLSSERIWRAVASDPVAVDLKIADRRIQELTAASADPAQKAQALNGYVEVLARLKSESDAQNSAGILRTLRFHQTELSGRSISIPELDHMLLPAGSNPPANPALNPGPVPSTKPKGIPTIQIPPTPSVP
jgi:hypothetical protein